MLLKSNHFVCFICGGRSIQNDIMVWPFVFMGIAQNAIRVGQFPFFWLRGGLHRMLIPFREWPFVFWRRLQKALREWPFVFRGLHRIV